MIISTTVTRFDLCVSTCFFFRKKKQHLTVLLPKWPNKRTNRAKKKRGKKRLFTTFQSNNLEKETNDFDGKSPIRLPFVIGSKTCGVPSKRRYAVVYRHQHTHLFIPLFPAEHRATESASSFISKVYTIESGTAILNLIIVISGTASTTLTCFIFLLVFFSFSSARSLSLIKTVIELSKNLSTHYKHRKNLDGSVWYKSRKKGEKLCLFSTRTL